MSTYYLSKPRSTSLLYLLSIFVRTLGIIAAMSFTRVTGSGTRDDPKIMWLCSVTRDINRTEGCENVSRQGCSITGTTYLWMRHVDHDTTRTRSRSGRRMVRTDPHLTVYMSRAAGYYEYEGHLFIVYDRRQRGKVPKRLAERRDQRLHLGSNPELWNYGTRRRARFPNMLA
ncbi:hypothetical protein F5Y04DRAFT_252840 [Hypomontagnella monticulosa]|nr:hypothetical protein F5Y04DRAFT_252840 [Hypomontagnella monticulosa]